VIDESDLQNEKHFDPRISTFLGIKIDSSDEDENANDLIRVKHEFDSNEIDESDLHLEKHFDPIILTFLGTTIGLSDEYENISDSIRVKCEFDSNTIDSSSPCCFPKPYSSGDRCNSERESNSESRYAESLYYSVHRVERD
jgi:hypothetical protein